MFGKRSPPRSGHLQQRRHRRPLQPPTPDEPILGKKQDAAEKILLLKEVDLVLLCILPSSYSTE